MAEQRVRGLLAVFDDPDAVVSAAEDVRVAGFTRWDVFTPFPVHGLDRAMGAKASPVPWITFIGGLAGFVAALALQVGTMVVSWPMNYGGKPHAAWPSFVPITFELTVLLAGLFTAFGALAIGGVLRRRKLKLDPAVTSHRFALFVDAQDPRYVEPGSEEMLRRAGAVEIRRIEEET